MALVDKAKQIYLSAEDVFAALRKEIIRREPDLSEEEFEISLAYDGYSYTVTATVNHL